MRSTIGNRSGLRALAAILLVVSPLGGCKPEELPVPTAEELVGYYEFSGDLDIDVSGNVPQVLVTINRSDYASGGPLWIKAFPYLFLFSSGTRQLFDEHPGVGGVRVIIRYTDGTIASQALLRKENLDLADWGRALAAAASAREEGTRYPSRMDDLVRIGESLTEYEYNLESN